ncbi:hypothetical protein ACQUEP_07695 [Enterococcus casseliflavus]|uniref:hypothetical protein n=1 Tax=Enterococcus casseliflavus TaxID=37734 RepID=UPI000EB137D6|nr:hypothetical protein [Enterococcus casseliflavus]AYJ45913.1 hypothetical protein D8N35_12810 [Enterococcus casseliflavus]
MKDYILTFFAFLAGIVPSVLLFFGVPNIISNYIKSRWDQKLDVLKAEQEKELQKELEAIRYDNSIRISEIQNEFQTKYQQLEHEFSVKFETMKKEYDVLPVLYEKIVTAFEYYRFNYKGGSLNNHELRYIADAKNYITLNKFFISSEIFDKSKECEQSIFELIHSKKEYSGSESARDIFLKSEAEQIENKIDSIIDELEVLIHNKLD